MVLINYASESERKKVEYIVSKWKDGTNKPEGYMFMVSDENYDPLIRELTHKIEPDKVRVFSLSELSIEPEIKSISFSLKINKNEKEVSSFLSYLVSKRKGIVTDSYGNTNSYSFITRKGNVKASITLTSGIPAGVTIQLEGAPEAAEMLRDEFRENLEIFGGA